MSTESPSEVGRIGRAVRAVPLDLLLLVALSLFVATTWASTAGRPVVRLALGGVFLFFAPGYALLAALVPASSRPHGTGFAPTTFGERLLLSFGASVTLLPLVALIVSVAGPLSTTRIVAVVAAVVLLGTLVGWVRRLRLPAEHRYSAPTDRWLSQTRAFLSGGSALTTAVNLVLAASVLVGVGAGAYVFATPQPDAEYTEFALLTDNGSNYVSGDYPTNLTRGQPANLTVSVENQHRDAAMYTVVAELQRVSVTDDDRIRVLSQSERTRFARVVEPDQTWYQPHRIRPRQAGPNQRLVYYLYRGDAPEDASAATADRQLQLWVNVSTGVSPPAG